jgi:hypothetical protein
MATDQHSTSRRAVIRALAAAPIIATASVVEAAATGGALTNRSSRMNMQAKIFDIWPNTRWQAAVETHRRLRAEWAAHPYGRTRPDSLDYDRLQEEEGVIAEQASRAFKTMLKAAAPDYPAFLEKLELFDEEFGDFLDGELTYLVNDARRLA